MSRERKPVGRSLRSKVAVKAESHKNDRNFSSYLKLPDGITVFKPKKEGNFRFNIIPYVAGKNNRDTDAGELDYEFTFWVHRIGTGEDQKTFICPKKTYGKPCPLCEQIEKLSKNYVENEDEIKELKAKQRQIFNIQDIRDEEEKIQIYETGYFKAFGEMLDKRLRPMDGDEEEDEDYRDFADIPGGRTLKVLFVEDSFNGHKFFAPSSIDFIDRKEELSDNIVEKAVCLDSCLKVLSYDDILKLIAGTTDELKDDEEEEEEKPVKKAKPAAKKTKPAPVEDEEEEEEEEDDDDTPVKETKTAAAESTKKKPKPAPADDDDDDEDEEEEKPVKKTKAAAKKAAPVEDDDEEEEEDDDDDEDEEEEKPVKKTKPATPSTSKKTKPAPVDDEEEDDDDEDDDEDDEEEEKPVKKTKPAAAKKAAPGEKKKGKCPAGYAFGADCYVYPECDECDMVEECDAAGE